MAAVCLFVLIAFSAIVVDYGILWASRGQAQTSADAGALAGAIAIAKARPMPSLATWPRSSPDRIQFGERRPRPATLSFPASCTRARPAPAAASRAHPRRCNARNVGRSGRRATNALPVFFASMLGITQQGVRATATAQVAAGNSTKCIKPWGVADKSEDNSGTGLNPSGWDQLDQFDPGVDTYIPSTSTGTTGFTLENDKGLQVALKGDHTNWLAGWSNEIQFPGATGSSDYEAAIVGCPSFIPEVGYYAGQPCDRMEDEDPARGCLRVKTGVAQGPTTDGVSTVMTWTSSRCGTRKKTPCQ